MAAKLYGVGVGPGDPELLTLKAKRILNHVDYIAVPKISSGKKSTALSIVEGAIKHNKKIIELVFPMSYDKDHLEESWDNAVETIKNILAAGKDVAFITLGDPTVYSTFMYIHKNIRKQGYDTEIVPGITSFCAATARIGTSLAENSETVIIIPSVYECANLEDVFDAYDNIVLMKVTSSFDRIKATIKSKGYENKVAIISKCGMDDELIEFDIDSVDQGNLSYFTTILVKKSGFN